MAFSQPFTSVDISITNNCNLRCKYCSHFESPSDVSGDLPAAEWVKFFGELKSNNVKSVNLIGGEPFCKDDLFEIIDGIVKSDMLFSVCSNGTLITDQTARFLASTKRCDSVQVSIDGSVPTTHDALRGEGTFKKAVEGIKLLQDNKINVNVRVTIHKKNVRELDSIAKFLLEDLGLAAFGTNAASYMGMCRKNTDQVTLTAEERTIAMESLLKLDAAYNGRIGALAGPLAEAKHWLVMEKARRGEAKDTPGRGYLTGCGMGFGKLGIRSDGAIVPCLLLSHIELGRVNKDRILDVWQNNPELAKLRNRRNIPLSNFDFCKGCEYINFCTGNCPGLSYAILGEVNHPSPDACLKRFLEAGGRLPDEKLLPVQKKEDRPSSPERPPQGPGLRYPLNQLYFYLTEGCNLACRHCWIAPKFQKGEQKYPALGLVLFESIIDQAMELGMRGLKLTGGEPLLHPRIKELIDAVKTRNLHLNMETNASLLTSELAARIAGCKNPFVGISLDGATARTHEEIRGVEGCFAATREGFRNLINVGIKPQLIFSVMRSNYGEIEAFAELAKSWGASSIKFNLVQPTARGEDMHKKGETLSVRELIELGDWVYNTLSKKVNINMLYSQPPVFQPFSRIYGDDQRGGACGVCGIFGILGVLSDGSYALCGIGESVPELVFGHASNDRLKDTWNDNKVLNELRQGLPKRLEGVCSDCVMKQRCLGSCIAQNYYRSKSLWAPFWYCEEAEKKGLFPETRLVRSLIKA